MLAISIKEKKAKVKNYADKTQMTFPVLLDTKAEVSTKFGIRGTPAHLIIDRKGDIKAFASGFKDLNSKASRNLIQFLVDQ